MAEAVLGARVGAAPGGPLGVVTIDGPAASGKSSVAQLVAERLGVPYVSSGLLYRGVALAALEAGVSPDDEAALIALLGRRPVALALDPAGNRLTLGGEDATGRAHSSEVDRDVSRVARHGGVRRWVNDALRALEPPFVAEGRDMGTRVFPGASAKLYLTAPARVRAGRRAAQRPEDLDAVEAAILERDRRDAPNSSPADDAVRIDTAQLDLEGVVRRALEAVRAARP